jgi:phosphopantothenoylcysteine decarboxylase/phosphopantothenate--cysteine ligase
MNNKNKKNIPPSGLWDPGAPAPGSLEELLSGKRVLLIVSGGIAAYKAAILARLLVKAGASIRTILTEGGLKFITPVTFEGLTQGDVSVSMWDRPQTEIEHISWGEWADIIVAAPATANFLADIAMGKADSLASATILASKAPKLLCPAMNANMYLNPATQDNIALLRKRGFIVLGSPVGELACGTEGPGRLEEPHDIFLQIIKALVPPILSGKKVIVTAGATIESWDSIRYLTNRSSGKMGVSLALLSYLAGAELKLIKGLSVAPLPYEAQGLIHRNVESTLDMLREMENSIDETDILFMAAAPADYRPKEKLSHKIKKDKEEISIPLTLNPDILKTLSPRKKKGSIWVGFAAETEKLKERALSKLKNKNLDLIVANHAGGPDMAFGKDHTLIHILSRERTLADSLKCSKFGAAWRIVAETARLMGEE